MQTINSFASTALRRFLALAFAAVLLAGCTSTTLQVSTPVALPPLSEKYAAIVVDAHSGQVLYQYGADTPRHPASLTKMMTLYVLFEGLRDRRFAETTPIPVSAYAASRPPTKIGFRAGEALSVEEAILSLVVKSANDVATAVAEYLGGSEAGFAAVMNAKARQLGMASTIFRNPHGLPDSAQITTARDMAVLSLALRRDFPQYYRYFSNKDFVYRGTTIRGHNELVGAMPGVDGLKTGYIRASGFNLATSAQAGGRSVVAVVLGGDTAKARNEHMRQLLEIYMPLASRAR